MSSCRRSFFPVRTFVGWLLWCFSFVLFAWSSVKGDCPPIYTPLNGNLVGQYENQCKTTEGSVCRVNCNFSYKLIGDFERVCSNGQWSGYEAFCVGKYRECVYAFRVFDLFKSDFINQPESDPTIRCPQTLRAPVNGFAIGLCQPYAGFTCKFSCAQGYTLSNPTPITCLTSGVWSNSQPTCEPTALAGCSTLLLASQFKNGQISCLNTNIAGKFEWK